MSQDVRQTELHERTQSLLQGPLKHARAAALAAVLIPLASVAQAQIPNPDPCASAGVCGTVWEDTNGNGIQDAGETGIPDVRVTMTDTSNPALVFEAWTDANGLYALPTEPGSYLLAVQIATDWTPSPDAVGAPEDIDSDGHNDGSGFSVFNLTLEMDGHANTDFGFIVNEEVEEVGTGTPGYWKNHPEAWPLANITVGNVTYTKAQALALLGKITKDRTTAMFSSLVSAMLNVANGTDASCVSAVITAANAWMTTNGPVGSGVAASSPAWKTGEPLHQHMDAYNNGLLCAPHRD